MLILKTSCKSCPTYLGNSMTKTHHEIVSGNAHDLRDVTEFIESLDKLEAIFEPQPELTIARAPGRLDVMGGIADYSGSLVLELPILEATFVALQKDDSRQLRIVSLLDKEILNTTKLSDISRAMIRGIGLLTSPECSWC